MNFEKQRDFEADKFNNGQPVYEFPANNAAYWRGVNHGFKKGADWLNDLYKDRNLKIQESVNSIIANSFDVHIVEAKAKEIETLISE